MVTFTYDNIGEAFFALPQLEPSLWNGTAIRTGYVHTAELQNVEYRSRKCKIYYNTTAK